MIQNNYLFFIRRGGVSLFFIDNCIDSAMLVGHNPFMAHMASFFLGSHIGIFPTSGVVYMEFDADSWDGVIKLKPVTQFVNFSQ